MDGLGSRSSSPSPEMVRPTAVAKALPASLSFLLTTGSCKAEETDPATWLQALVSVPNASLISSWVGPSSDATRRYVSSSWSLNSLNSF